MHNIKKKSLLRTTALAIVFATSVSTNAFSKNEVNNIPNNCAANSNISELNNKLPQIAKDFNTLSLLPLSGRSVYNAIKNPNNGIFSCSVPINKNSIALGAYINNKIFLGKESTTSTYLHEAFHAAQDINTRGNLNFPISIDDFGFKLFLTEATAVAYQLILNREAKNHGLSYNKGKRYNNRRMSTADNKAIISLFNKNYNNALKKHSYLNKSLRTSKSLESAGKSVVRYLLEGKNPIWSVGYLTLASQNIKTNEYLLNAYSLYIKPIDYNNSRKKLYKNIGKVSNNINLTPDKYIGINSDINIKNSISSIKKAAIDYMISSRRLINYNR